MDSGAASAGAIWQPARADGGPADGVQRCTDGGDHGRWHGAANWHGHRHLPGAALVAGLFQFGGDLYPMLGIVAVFMVGQALEGMVLTPLLVGDRIGLHPVAVIFAILAGGELFGFTGILLALPVAAVIMVLVRHVHDLYKDSDVYTGVEDPDL